MEGPEVPEVAIKGGAVLEVVAVPDLRDAAEAEAGAVPVTLGKMVERAEQVVPASLLSKSTMASSLYPDYVKEREGLETLESDYGFAMYKIIGNELYCKEIYILPEHRRAGHAFDMGNALCEIGKMKGCQWFIGTVSPQANGAHESMLGLIKYGMKLLRSEFNLVYFIKRI